VSTNLSADVEIGGIGGIASRTASVLRNSLVGQFKVTSVLAQLMLAVRSAPRGELDNETRLKDRLDDKRGVGVNGRQ
jgi:hypothetical protein